MGGQKRVWGWVLVLIGLVMAIRTGANLWRLYRLGDEVKMIEKEVAEAKAENKRLQERLKEVQSPEFAEREARDKLGYAREGEEIMIIPKAPILEKNQVKEEVVEENWKKWKRLYWGKG